MEPYNGQTKFKCFNNQDIPITGQIHMELHSGSWTAKNCNILVVKHGSQNLMGRDILAKLGLTLTQQQNEDRKLLKQPVLSPATIWDMDQDSEPELNIQYREDAKKGTRPEVNIESESDDSENAPLLSPTRTPEEKRQMKQRQEQLKQGTSTATTSAPSGENLYSHEQIVSIAKKNQRTQQQKRRTNKAQETPARKQQLQKQQEKISIHTAQKQKTRDASEREMKGKTKLKRHIPNEVKGSSITSITTPYGETQSIFYQSQRTRIIKIPNN